MTSNCIPPRLFCHNKHILSRLVTKPTKWHVRPAKTQISLGIRPSLIRVFAVRLKKAWILSYPLSAQRWLWLGWADAQAYLNLRWAHMPFCWFCHDAARTAEGQIRHSLIFLLYNRMHNVEKVIADISDRIWMINNLKRNPLKTQHPKFENSRLCFIEPVHER